MMAEFKKVMRQWRRFCKSHNNCRECEFDGKGICGEAHLSDVPYTDIELRIMSWAAEHSEPVYPTWVEWLMSEGVIPNYYTTSYSTESGVRAATFYVTSKAFNPIPDDIAQKLGIEPKEG